MSALLLGLIAALCWAFHDICVRFLSKKTPLTACIFIVLLTGLLFHLSLMVITDGFTPVTNGSVWLSLAAGVFFVVATFGLYHAFQRGPVRLVAPLIASYPILSVAVATVQGSHITIPQWIAVFAIVIGVAVVAALSDTSQGAAPPKGPTILYAIIASIGFAGTFALGQHAAEISGEMPTTLITRILAIGLTVLILLFFRLPFWPGWRTLPLLLLMGVADGIALLGGVRPIRTRLCKANEAAPYAAPRARHSARAAARFSLKLSRE